MGFPGSLWDDRSKSLEMPSFWAYTVTCCWPLETAHLEIRTVWKGKDKAIFEGLISSPRWGCPTDVDRAGLHEDSDLPWWRRSINRCGLCLWMKMSKESLCFQRRLITRLFFHLPFGTAILFLASSCRWCEMRVWKINDTQLAVPVYIKYYQTENRLFIVLRDHGSFFLLFLSKCRVVMPRPTNRA